MKGWLKDHVLEMVAIAISLGGAKGLFDFWSRLLDMFDAHLAEALFACILSASVAAIVVAFIMRRSERRKLAAKDAEIEEMDKRPKQEKVDDLERRLSARNLEVDELKKRPTQDEVDALISAKDAEIAALRSTKVPTPLDMLKASLGDEGIASFRALCAASTYVDGKPARP